MMFARWFITNLTPAVIVSLFALAISIMTLYLTQWHRQSKLLAVVSWMTFPIDEKSRTTIEGDPGEESVTFSFDSDVKLELVNSGNAPSALIALRPIVTTRSLEHCAYPLRYGAGESIELGDSSFVGPSYPIKTTTVAPGSISPLRTRVIHKRASLPTGRTYTVCLQFFVLDHKGDIHYRAIEVSDLAFTKGIQNPVTRAFSLGSLDIIP